MIKRVVPKNVESMLALIYEYRIANLGEIHGINDNELKIIEQQYGELPKDYREILKSIGKKAGKLIKNTGEFQLYFNDILKLNKEIHELRKEAILEGDKVAELPKDIFFICARYFESPYFVKTNSIDSSVYHYNEEKERVDFLYDSVWEVYADFILERKFFIDLARAKEVSENERQKVLDEYTKAGFIS